MQHGTERAKVLSSTPAIRMLAAILTRSSSTPLHSFLIRFFLLNFCFHAAESTMGSKENPSADSGDYECISDDSAELETDPEIFNFSAFLKKGSRRMIPFTGTVAMELQPSVISESLAAKFPDSIDRENCRYIKTPFGSVQSTGRLEVTFCVVDKGPQRFKAGFLILPDLAVAPGKSIFLGTSSLHVEAMIGSKIAHAIGLVPSEQNAVSFRPLSEQGDPKPEPEQSEQLETQQAEEAAQAATPVIDSEEAMSSNLLYPMEGLSRP